MTRAERSELAKKLGELARGKKKTMTPAALKARKMNARRPRKQSPTKDEVRV